MSVIEIEDLSRSFGDTSEFRVQSNDLVGVSRFEGTIPRLTVRGVDYENVLVQFPGGER